MMNKKLKNIRNLSYKEANKIILDICNKKGKLSLSDIEIIFNLDEKELVDTFLSEYDHFDIEDFLYIENFINSNLEHSNRTFVSDLIYFASDFGLDLNYKKIIDFLIIEKTDEDFIVLACLQYLHVNIKFLYIEELIKNLNYIRDNSLYHQNEQLLASLILYRTTYKLDYLDFIKELIEYDESNLEFLKNTLKEKMYDYNNFNSTEFNNRIGW